MKGKIHDINLYNLKLKELPEFLSDLEVSGEFCANSNCLVNFLNSPKKVEEFYAQNNKLTSLEGCPEIVNGSFIVSGNLLTNIDFFPKTIKNSISLSNNKLLSLHNLPEIVYGGVSVGWNNLQSLKGCPKIIYGYFDCSYNNLKSLENGPELVDGNFYCNGNADFAEEYVRSIIKISGRVICRRINQIN
jgi:hypothetical protein